MWIPFGDWFGTQSNTGVSNTDTGEHNSNGTFAIKKQQRQTLNTTNSVSNKKRLPGFVLNTVIGEAVGEGIDGMQAVFNVMNNQAAFYKQPLENTVKTKYAAYKRRDLGKFVNRQPREVRDTVSVLLNSNPDDITNGALHFENVQKYGIPKYAKQEGGIIPLAHIKNHLFFVTLREYNILVKNGKMKPGLEKTLIKG